MRATNHFAPVSDCEMNRAMTRVAFGLLLSFALAACNQSSTPAAPGGGTGGTVGPPATGGSGGTGTGGSGGTAGGSGTGGSAGMGGAAGGNGGAGGSGGIGLGDGACDNVDDLDALSGLLPNNARNVAASCGVACAALTVEALYVQCVVECVQDDVPGLSEGCATCYGDFAWCLGLGCNSNCEIDACDPVCESETSCPGYGSCFADLNQCAGRNSRDCGET